MTMFHSDADIDAAMGDAEPNKPEPAAPAPVPTPAPTPELAKLLDRPLVPVGYSNGEFIPGSMEGIQRMATMFVDSGLYPQLLTGCANRNAAIARMTIALSTGAKIGLTYHAAASNLAMINNRLCLWGDALVAVVRRRPECVGIKDEYDEKTKTHTCTGTRRHADGTVETVTHTFSEEDAKRAKLLGKPGPWTNNQRRMQQNRARAFVIRDLWADFLFGVCMAEEQKDIEESARAERVGAVSDSLSKLAT